MVFPFTMPWNCAIIRLNRVVHGQLRIYGLLSEG